MRERQRDIWQNLRRQRLKSRSHKPRIANSHQKLEEARNGLSLQASDTLLSTWWFLFLDFWPLELWKNTCLLFSGVVICYGCFNKWIYTYSDLIFQPSNLPLLRSFCINLDLRSSSSWSNWSHMLLQVLNLCEHFLSHILSLMREVVMSQHPGLWAPDMCSPIWKLRESHSSSFVGVSWGSTGSGAGCLATSHVIHLLPPGAPDLMQNFHAQEVVLSSLVLWSRWSITPSFWSAAPSPSQ